MQKARASIAFLGSLAISIAGTIVALGGMASMTAFCTSNNGIFDGIKKEYQAQAKLLYGNSSCGEIFRFEWWGWALQFAFLAFTAVCYMTTNVHTYKSALWSMASCAIVLAMLNADELIDLYEKTVGDLHTRGIVTFLGYCAFCTGNFLMMFSGNALYHFKRAEFVDKESVESKLNGVTVA